MRGWLNRSRVRWTPDSLDGLQDLVDGLPLHPEDRSAVGLKISMTRHYTDSSGCRAELFGLVQGLIDRYAHPPDPMGSVAVDTIRAQLPGAQRGRGVRAMFGEFRRGEAVCRVVGRRKGRPVIEDGVFLEAEPASDHARRFGRMGGIQLVDDLSLTRWFLDDMHHGREYGRPW